MYSRYIKRLVDIVLSLFALIVLSPVIFITALMVKIKLGSPILFKHKRPGKGEKIFTLYKFRTMTNDKDENGELLPNHERLTQFGKFLRSTSLDELPELFNIIKGDMSIVGPRPLLIRYLPLYNEIQRQRHNVKPGLTGLAQVSGRNAISWEQKFELDVEYVERISLLLDVKIIFLTFWKSFVKVEGINTEDDSFMEDFKGSKDEILNIKR